jgi:lysozyme family protein
MLIPDYKALWSSMTVNDSVLKVVKMYSDSITQFKQRYENVGNGVCPGTPVPWYFIGLIHHMESGQSFQRHLHNGDPLSARTTHVPAGRPINGQPPFGWEESAIDALSMMGYEHPHIWDIDDVLARLEGYNGTGYRQHDIYTPYLWSGTNHYTKGRYIQDGKFSATTTSAQIGCAPILSFLLK